jgi:hypothetical protein
MIDIEKELAESLEELIDGIMDIRGVDIEVYVPKELKRAFDALMEYGEICS